VNGPPRQSRERRSTESLEIRAEIVKLARLLHCEVERLAYLEEVAIEDLRALRERATQTLFGAQEGTLRRLAAASKLLPAGLIASLSQHPFGPMLSARITGLLDADRAVEIAARLPIEFLADVAVELDPRRASEVIAGIPAARISKITSALAERQEYVTMGRFVGHLGDEALCAALSALDDEALLQTMFVTEDRLPLDELTARLGEERIGCLHAAAERKGVRLEQLTR
jgi:hypothetical protein